jgi:hypothetical protein
MKDLSGARGWEYAYRKELEAEIEIMRDALEDSGEEHNYLRGQIRGIRIAISRLTEVRERFNADEDEDIVMENL